MKIKTFVVEPTGSQNNLKILTVPTLGFQATLKNNKIHNVEPFTLLVDERVMVHNYAERVQVSVLNLETLTGTFDSMSVFAIANTQDVQRVINDSLKFDKWDAAITKAEQVNDRAVEAVNQVELEMTMDDIQTYHLQQAIDYALDKRDEALFHQLVQQRKDVQGWI